MKTSFPLEIARSCVCWFSKVYKGELRFTFPSAPKNTDYESGEQRTPVLSGVLWPGSCFSGTRWAAGQGFWWPEFSGRLPLAPHKCLPRYSKMEFIFYVCHMQKMRKLP